MKFSQDLKLDFLRVFLEARNFNFLTEKNILLELGSEDKQEIFVNAIEYNDKIIGLGGIKKHLKKVISVLEKNFVEINEQIYQFYIEVNISTTKVGCAFLMVVVNLLPHPVFGPTAY